MNNLKIENKEELEMIMLKYEFTLKTLVTQLELLIKEYEFNHKYNPVEHLKSRVKKSTSALKKLEEKGYELTVDNLLNHVHDMVGIRIVCSFLSDVYTIVNIIENSKELTIKEKKDYITNPKNSGYSSYHLIVLVPIYLNGKVEQMEAEIQIRTIAMDFWASLDHKIQYKFPKEIPEEVKKEMFNCSLDIRNLDHKMLGLNYIVNKYNEDETTL